MEFEKSCGAVIYTKANDTIKYVLVQSLEGFWGFPKGHMEKGETEEQTALREIFEEVHLRVNISRGFRTTGEHMIPNKEGIMKQIVYFLAEYYNQDIIPRDDELAKASLATYEEAMQLFQFESTKRILQEVQDFLLNG